MAHKRKKPLGEDALGRILQAVGMELVPVPESKQINFGEGSPLLPWITPKNIQLVAHLLCAVDEYYEAVDRRNNSKLRKEILQIENIIEQSHRFRHLVVQAEGDWRENFQTEILYDEIEDLLRHLNEAHREMVGQYKFGLDWLEEQQCNLPPGALSNRFKGSPPFEWLVGHFLPEVFEICFGKRASPRRLPDDTPDGPYIRFAEQVLTEFSITVAGRAYGRESIIKALTDARKKIKNRKR